MSFRQETEMRSSLHCLTSTAALVLSLAATSTAQAQGKGHDKKHEKEHAKQAQLRNDDRYRGDRDPRYDRRDDDRRRYDESQRAIPPGLAKKPGGMPPGQYKKLYSARQGASVLSEVLGRHGYSVVRTTDAGDSRFVFYRDQGGALHRATVTPNGDRLRFSSVPRALLNELNARLY
jgi:hypothetical protein